MEKIKPVIFRVGNNIFGVDISKVQAIELFTEIVPVPKAVDCVEGLINIRGEVIPVYNLRARNKDTDSQVNYNEQQYILVNCNGEKIALMVDNVEDIKDIKDESYQKLPIICRNENNEYVDGVVHLGDVLVIVIDIDKLLSHEEIDVLNKIIKD